MVVTDGAPAMADKPLLPKTQRLVKLIEDNGFAAQNSHLHRTSRKFMHKSLKNR